MIHCEKATASIKQGSLKHSQTRCTTTGYLQIAPSEMQSRHENNLDSQSNSTTRPLRCEYHLRQLSRALCHRQSFPCVFVLFSSSPSSSSSASQITLIMNGSWITSTDGHWVGDVGDTRSCDRNSNDLISNGVASRGHLCIALGTIFKLWVRQVALFEQKIKAPVFYKLKWCRLLA